MSGPPAGPAAQAQPGLVNLPNGLTVLRLALVPVFVACLVAGSDPWRYAAFVVFAVASVTDLLDGELARRRGLITDFGKIADPIADKALTGSALITLSALGELPWWVTAVILARELGVTALRLWVIRHGVIPASRGGKVKTVLQMIAIGLYILPVHVGWVRATIMGAAVVVTVVTGADYVVRALRLRRDSATRGVPASAARPSGASGPAGASGPSGAAGRAGASGASGGVRDSAAGGPGRLAGTEERAGTAGTTETAGTAGAAGDGS